VAVYTHKEPRQLLHAIAGERIHRAEALELYALDRALLADLAGHLERRTAFALSIADRHLFVTADGATMEGAVTRLTLPEG
jgi:uncharacterized protein YaeQ